MELLGRRRRSAVLVSHDAREAELVRQEEARAREVHQRRLYYEGRQYDRANEAAFATLAEAGVERLPEHKRLHAYSTQIAECVDFLADRLGEGFVVNAVDPKVQQVIDGVVAATPEVAAENDEGDVEIVTDDLLREAFVAQDVPVYVGWDPFEGRCYWEFWESEAVEFRLETARKVEKVIRTQVAWREVPAASGVELREVTERVEYEMVPNEAGVAECRRSVYWDEDEDPREVEWLGIGRLPWTLLRADSRKMRTFRGESLVSRQAMEAADRYNANEQIAYLIARYNSHGNVAVIGDGASLKLETDGRISKDVADVLTFPGGTALQVLTLPTDPKMIEHQKQVLADSLYAMFGLTRVDHDTLSGLGHVSGYALEILNQKTEATFKRVRRAWRKDLTTLVGLTLDVHAWKQAAPVGVLDTQTLEFVEVPDLDDLEPVDGQVPMAAWWQVDPQVVYPNRKVEIRMGSGYIVDDVMIRDDFVAGLISLEEALRQRGMNDAEIDTIVGEIDARTPALPETGFGGVRPGGASSNGTKAGSTVGSTERR